jgi:hypothetical protein
VKRIEVENGFSKPLIQKDIVIPINNYTSARSIQSKEGSEHAGPNSRFSFNAQIGNILHMEDKNQDPTNIELTSHFYEPLKRAQHSVGQFSR